MLIHTQMDIKMFEQFARAVETNNAKAPFGSFVARQNIRI